MSGGGQAGREIRVKLGSNMHTIGARGRFANAPLEQQAGGFDMMEGANEVVGNDALTGRFGDRRRRHEQEATEMMGDDHGVNEDGWGEHEAGGENRHEGHGHGEHEHGEHGGNPGFGGVMRGGFGQRRRRRGPMLGR